MNRIRRPDVFCKKGVFSNFSKFTGKNLCQSLYFNKVAGLQVLSCEICEISKNTFSYRTPPVAASESTTQPNANLPYPRRNSTHFTWTKCFLPIKQKIANIRYF